ncbi:hypothetical protein ABPG72_005945 [Tetrahymena utriculariae]
MQYQDTPLVDQPKLHKDFDEYSVERVNYKKDLVKQNSISQEGSAKYLQQHNLINDCQDKSSNISQQISTLPSNKEILRQNEKASTILNSNQNNYEGLSEEKGSSTKNQEESKEKDNSNNHTLHIIAEVSEENSSTAESQEESKENNDSLSSLGASSEESISTTESQEEFKENNNDLPNLGVLSEKSNTRVEALDESKDKENSSWTNLEESKENNSINERAVVQKEENSSKTNAQEESNEKENSSWTNLEESKEKENSSWTNLEESKENNSNNKIAVVQKEENSSWTNAQEESNENNSNQDNVLVLQAERSFRTEVQEEFKKTIIQEINESNIQNSKENNSGDLSQQNNFLIGGQEQSQQNYSNNLTWNYANKAIQQDIDVSDAQFDENISFLDDSRYLSFSSYEELVGNFIEDNSIRHNQFSSNYTINQDTEFVYIYNSNQNIFGNIFQQNSFWNEEESKQRDNPNNHTQYPASNFNMEDGPEQQEILNHQDQSEIDYLNHYLDSQNFIQAKEVKKTEYSYHPSDQNSNNS